jgi:hypothetical protein
MNPFSQIDKPFPHLGTSVALPLIDGPMRGLTLRVPLYGGATAFPRPASAVDVEARGENGGTVRHRYRPIVNPADDGPLWLLSHVVTW